VHFETACGISGKVQHPAMIDVNVRHSGEEILFTMKAVGVRRQIFRRSDAQFLRSKNSSPIISGDIFERT